MLVLEIDLRIVEGTSNRMIAGVSAQGWASIWESIPPSCVCWSILAFFTGFGGIALVYLIMALVVPEQAQITQ